MAFNEDDLRREANKSAGKARDYMNDPDKMEGLLSKVSKMNLTGELLKEIRLLISLVKDYISGKYTKLPTSTILAVVGAIIYVAAPIDLIPDFIPLLGFTDDAAVVALVIKNLHDDVTAYAEWKDAIDVEGDPID